MASVETQPGQQEDEKHGWDQYHLSIETGDDKLSLTVKDSNTKRAFSNSFTKKDLNAMYLHQPPELIKSMITMAKQERSEIDILRDIIGDVRNDNKLLKEGLTLVKAKIIELEEKLAQMETKTDDNKNDIETGIAMWRSSKCFKSSGNIKWDVESIAPTLKNMIERSEDQRGFTFKIAGI